MLLLYEEEKKTIPGARKKAILYSLYKYFFYISVVGANTISKAMNICVSIAKVIFLSS